MKKYFATLLAAVSLLTVSYSKDDDPTTEAVMQECIE